MTRPLATWVPNGVDLDRFDRVELTPDERLARWREWLVEEPQGWSEGGEPGTRGLHGRRT